MTLSRFLKTLAVLGGLFVAGTGIAWAFTYDSSGNLLTNCASGCAGGSTSNGSDGVTTSSNNGSTVDFPYMWNGTTFDRVTSAGKFGYSGGPILAAGSFIYTGANFKAVNDVVPNADAVNAGTDMQWSGGPLYLYNGSTWDRARSQIQSGTNPTGVQNVFVGGYNYGGGGNSYVPVALSPDIYGHAAFFVTPAGRRTYKLAGVVTPAATPTDVIVIKGSATAKVRITKVEISVASTAAGIADVLLIKRSTANSGGTSTTPTIGQLDTSGSAVTAVGTVYTANAASLGTTVANVGAKKVTGTTIDLASWDFGTRGTDAVVLNNANEYLAVNGNGDTLLTGEAWAYDIEWTEE